MMSCSGILCLFNMCSCKEAPVLVEEFMDESVNDMLQDLKSVVGSLSRARSRAVDGEVTVDEDDIKELEILTKALESYLLLSK